jgi:hypothetical protein
MLSWVAEVVAIHNGAHRWIAGEMISIIDVFEPARRAQRTDGMTRSAKVACPCRGDIPAPARSDQPERGVQFTMRKQSGIGGDAGAMGSSHSRRSKSKPWVWATHIVRYVFRKGSVI